MVNVIWVLENIRKSINFYNPFDTKLILTSVSQWKKHNPNTHTVLYCDKLTYDTFNKIQLLEAWDDVKIIAPSEGIDKNIFWASAKVEVLQGINAPTIILDNDFVVYKSFEHLLKDNVIVTHDENGQDYYPDPLDPYVRRTNHLLNRPNHMSINCSFLYFPNFKFANAYASTSVELMKELTKLKAPNSNYLVYAEQLLLKHLLDLHNQKYDTLVNEIWHCKERYFSPTDEGLIDRKEQKLWFRHYWMDKPKILNNEDGFSLIKETEQLDNSVKNHMFDKKTYMVNLQNISKKINEYFK